MALLHDCRRVRTDLAYANNESLGEWNARFDTVADLFYVFGS